MSAPFITDVTCPTCGAVNQRKEHLVDMGTAVLLNTYEVIWCGECRAEIRPRSGGADHE